MQFEDYLALYPPDWAAKIIEADFWIAYYVQQIVMAKMEGLPLVAESFQAKLDMWKSTKEGMIANAKEAVRPA